MMGTQEPVQEVKRFIVKIVEVIILDGGLNKIPNRVMKVYYFRFFNIDHHRHHHHHFHLYSLLHTSRMRYSHNHYSRVVVRDSIHDTRNK